MRNSALGRGLGDLMESRPANRTAAPTAAPAPDATPRSSGVHIFLNPASAERNLENGHPTTPVGNTGTPVSAPARAFLLPLVLADAVLCGLAWLVVARSNDGVGWLGWSLVTLAVALGAWLSVLAFHAPGAERGGNRAENGRLNVDD